MSKIHLIILNVILLVAVLISSQFIYAETIESNTNITEPDSIALLKPMLPTVDLHKYYDIVPGDERWENLCLSEKLQAQQLKPDILDSIPTSDLLDICLFNPYIANYGCYDNLNEGLESVINTFNMYPVLLSRKDAVSLICNKYIAFNYTKVNNALNTHKLHFINFLSIEAYLMAGYLLQKDSFSGLDESLLFKLFLKSFEEFSLNQDNERMAPDVIIQDSDCMIMNKIMLKYNYIPLIKDTKLQKDITSDQHLGIMSKNVKQRILKHADKFLASKNTK